MTLHWALTPHRPGHGSTHFNRWHALLDGQSALIVHSGLHATYGSPRYSGIHVHAAAPFLSEQRAFCPHGDGLQGSGAWVGILGAEIQKHALVSQSNK